MDAAPVTHTWHCVLILDDDLPQEPALIVLIHGRPAGGRGGAGPAAEGSLQGRHKKRMAAEAPWNSTAGKTDWTAL